MRTDRRGNSSIIRCHCENAPPIACIAGEEPSKRTDSLRLLFKELRIIEIDEEANHAAIFWWQMIKKIENPMYIGVGVCIFSCCFCPVRDEIGNHLPKYASAQPRLARSLGMDAMMHDNFWIIDSVVSQFLYLC